MPTVLMSLMNVWSTGSRPKLAPRAPAPFLLLEVLATALAAVRASVVAGAGTDSGHSDLLLRLLMFSLLALAGQLLADLLYAVVDPRVTYH